MKKILAVDDRKSSLKVLAAILSDEGYDVIQAVSGEEALNIYQSGMKIDAILSDFKMPKMNGVELFHKMESIKKNAALYHYVGLWHRKIGGAGIKGRGDPLPYQTLGLRRVVYCSEKGH